MRDVLELRTLRAVSAGSCAPFAEAERDMRHVL